MRYEQKAVTSAGTVKNQADAFTLHTEQCGVLIFHTFAGKISHTCINYKPIPYFPYK